MDSPGEDTLDDPIHPRSFDLKKQVTEIPSGGLFWKGQLVLVVNYWPRYLYGVRMASGRSINKSKAVIVRLC